MLADDFSSVMIDTGHRTLNEVNEAETITVHVPKLAFESAKRAFQDRCGLELTDQEFIQHAMMFVENYAPKESQIRALESLGKTPIVITQEELSEILGKVQRLQFANSPPYIEKSLI